ncbi:outer membrane beta-barrel protein [Nitrogeniibacter mangrovi]|uniref:Outer membrane beta-barrel protein n=1 Tax=Nitrogeniibacter mangrovi TaxID=2016596 RepID=A0A6C1B1R6_9RHOO|nr:XrtB/PEP-CTERM-associated polysaccharide biosynthesis outer membrane protein EpsL [Nitrogeniibacter mangrovi]QID16758.1 outer membrane beta-barrel protein [Nitrogeniibacter mangrovi]
MKGRRAPGRDHRCAYVIFCAALAFGAGPVHAEDPADALNVYISQSFQHDDNIYRLPDGVRPFGNGQRGDTISVTSLSAVFDRVYGRQRLHASADLSRAGFAEWSDLDYTTKGAAAGWDWRVGPRWTGTLQVDQKEVARDFADVQTNRRETSINRQRTFKASASYWWHPDWAVGMGWERYNSAYSDRASERADYRASIPEISLTYRPESGNRLSLSARFTDGEYPNRVLTATADEGFRQSDVRMSGRWRLTGLSVLSGYLGYTRRTYRNLSIRNFSGMTGRLQYDWTITGKVSLRSTVRREIGARQDLIDNFVVTKAVSLEPSWAATSRIAVHGKWEWRKRDFGGDPGIVVSAPSQDEKTRTLRLSVSYLVRDYLSLSLSHTRNSRTSDQPNKEYDARVSSLTAQLSF